MNPPAFGKWIILAGILIVLVGVVISIFGRLPYIGRLPGDFVIRRAHSTIYVPVTSCVLLSIMISIFLRLFRS